MEIRYVAEENVYIDVGQGDASLIEAENAIVIIDGGPNTGLHSYLKKRLDFLQGTLGAMIILYPMPLARQLNTVLACFHSFFQRSSLATTPLAAESN
jgi:hypothetical protein